MNSTVNESFSLGSVIYIVPFLFLILLSLQCSRHKQIIIMPAPGNTVISPATGKYKVKIELFGTGRRKISYGVNNLDPYYRVFAHRNRNITFPFRVEFYITPGSGGAQVYLEASQYYIVDIMSNDYIIGTIYTNSIVASNFSMTNYGSNSQLYTDVVTTLF